MCVCTRYVCYVFGFVGDRARAKGMYVGQGIGVSPHPPPGLDGSILRFLPFSQLLLLPGFCAPSLSPFFVHAALCLSLFFPYPHPHPGPLQAQAVDLLDLDIEGETQTASSVPEAQDLVVRNFSSCT